MNGLGRAVRDARWAARGLILSDTGARPGCCCYRDTSGDGGDNRCQQLAAERRDNSYRTPEEESNGLAAAQPHLAFRLVTTAATTPPPTAELRLTDRPGQVANPTRGGGAGLGAGLGVTGRSAVPKGYTNMAAPGVWVALGAVS